MPGELTSITMSDDLSRLIPSEFAALAIPAMRGPFWARWAEKRLLTYDTRGSERAGRGAIIAVIDSSYSMSDAAKAGSAGGVVQGARPRAARPRTGRPTGLRRDLVRVISRDPGVPVPRGPQAPAR